MCSGSIVDPHLVQRRLGVLADLVALLGHDRDLAHLGQERPAPSSSISAASRGPAGEDPEVDPDLEPWRLGLGATQKRELRLSTSSKPVIARVRET